MKGFVKHNLVSKNQLQYPIQRCLLWAKCTVNVFLRRQGWRSHIRQNDLKTGWWFSIAPRSSWEITPAFFIVSPCHYTQTCLSNFSKVWPPAGPPEATLSWKLRKRLSVVPPERLYPVFAMNWQLSCTYTMA